jgi:uncharacterized protein YdaU (DUF1376 family)
MSARWYKRCGADFIHGTMSLTLEEKGAYSLCLDLIYDRGAAIPDDARWLSGVCGVSIRKWNALRERLIETGKIYAANGLLSNARADLEMVSAELQRRNQAESGAKGGRKRAENAGQSPKNSDLAQATLKPIEEIREDKKEIPKGILPIVPIADEPPDDEKLKPEHVLEAWNDMARTAGLQSAKLMTPARRKRLRSMVAQHPPDDFAAALDAVARSSWCRGENDRGWKADFDFFLQPKSFTKLLEGSYV